MTPQSNIWIYHLFWYEKKDQTQFQISFHYNANFWICHEALKWKYLIKNEQVRTPKEDVQHLYIEERLIMLDPYQQDDTNAIVFTFRDWVLY